MPRYTYKCQECDVSIEANHSYKDTLKNCPKCKISGSLQKIMSPIKINKTKQFDEKKKTGEVVEEHIEDNRMILSGLKKNLEKRVYKK